MKISEIIEMPIYKDMLAKKIDEVRQEMDACGNYLNFKSNPYSTLRKNGYFTGTKMTPAFIECINKTSKLPYAQRQVIENICWSAIYKTIQYINGNKK